MIPKKMLLFSASMLLFVYVSAQAQQPPTPATPALPATPATPVAQAETSPVVAIGAQGGNYLGITASEVTRENMGRYNLREPRGVAVTRVAEGSPASRAGLRAGDVILRFDGEEVGTYRKLQRLISEAGPEQTVRLSISRNGAEQEISVTLGKRENAFQALSRVYGVPPRATEAPQSLLQFGNMSFFGRRIGVNTTPLTRQLADYFGVAGGRGLLITSVADNSPAAQAGLKAGDVIIEADGEKVESSGDLSRVLNRKSEGSVNLRVVRDRSQLNLTVTPEKREAGSFTFPSELFELESKALEITVPDIEIPVVKMAPIRIPAIAIPKLKIKPMQLEQLKKLENLKFEMLKLEDLMWL